MKTYNFILVIGSLQHQVEINAKTQEEAIRIVKKEYPNWNYILI